MFLKIDMETLSQLMEARGISRSSLSKKLGVCPKTVQRWRTGTVRRLNPEKVAKLAAILDVQPESLLQKSSSKERLAHNRDLEDLCSTSFVQKVRIFSDWESYRKLLKNFDQNNLKPRQRMMLNKHLGFSSLFVGKIRAAKFYLDEALKLATELNSIEQKIFIINWAATRAVVAGNFLEALEILTQSEHLLKQTADPQCLSDFLFKKGRALHSLEKYQEAIRMTRRSISIDYELDPPNMIELSNKYTYLGETYLRMRDFRNAEISFRRAEKTAAQCGWVNGQIYCHFCFAIIKLFSGQSMQEVRHHFGRAKRFIKYSRYHRLDIQSEQIEFLYFLFDQNLTEAKNVLLRRLDATHSIPSHFAYAVLDGLLFSKMYPEVYKIRPSLLNKAEEFFKKNHLQMNLAFLELLRQKETISMQEALSLYLF